tara:strand:- start:105633 stop:106253 length:621 start_codon:yes stop_codon:yes gene_type:complete
MARYICIEGNIGSGKTTLAKALSKKLNTRLVLEEFEGNAFLEKFYKNPKRYAFPVEMTFLAERYKQLSEILSKPEDMFQRDIIADYSISKSLLFAKNNLDLQEFVLYKDLFEILNTKLRKPDLIIFLDRSIGSTLENIKKRGRPYEMNIDEEYLMDIKERYKQLLINDKTANLLVLNAENYDFIDKPKDLDILIEEINTFTGNRIT